MTPEQIEAMALEAGATIRRFGTLPDGTNQFLGADFKPDALERFAALVAAAERERCAKVCESSWVGDSINDGFAPGDGAYNDGRRDCAAAIRALG